MHSTKLAIDSIIDDRYQLVELLGEGGSGSTYRATRLADGASVAIKILLLRHLNDWKQLELFEREAKVLAQISHPQIPKYLEYFHVDTPDNRAFYIVQQLAPGRPLTDWVQSGWHGTEAEVRDIASQLLEILQYLHHQSPPLIHRDLKPHNIIRNDDGQVFLVDFGAVQNVYHNTLLKGCTVAGTFGYMAPEQFRGLAVPASDLYGLGATILYLLTHRSPADLPQERLKLSFRTHVNISNHFADWLEMMLEPDTAERFSSADVALSALQKQHRFRTRRATKISFPWKGVAIAATILSISVPLIHQYRYALITRIGLPAHDICTAIKKRGVTALPEYLDQGVNINANVILDPVYSKTGSLLHCAIEYGQAEAVKYLLDKGADVNAFSSETIDNFFIGTNDGTPLQRIITKYCLSEDKLCHNSNLKIYQYLLQYKPDFNVKNSSGQSSLMLAVERGNILIFKHLIENGANPYDVDIKKSSLWHVLSRLENNQKEEIKEIAKELARLKVDVNQQDIDGNTPLHVASKINYSGEGELGTIETLLKYKAKIDLINNQGQTPLIEAISSSSFDNVKIFLESGADVNYPGRDRKTPLIRAIEAASTPRDLFTSQNFTKSALPSLADASEATKTIELLIQKGANPNLVDLNGDTALHLLGKFGEIDSAVDGCYQARSMAIRTLDLLMHQKVDLQAVNNDGDTALHILAKQDFFPLTDRMIRYGWNPLQKNRQGKNALELMESAPPRASRCQQKDDKQ